MLNDNHTEDGNYDDIDGTDKETKRKRPKLKPVYEHRKCLEKDIQSGGVFPTVEKCADFVGKSGCKYVQYS